MSALGPNTFKVVQLNAENLFLFLDSQGPYDWRNMTEKEWQTLSNASVPNKNLHKTIWLADSLLDINPDIICLNEVGGEESLSNFNKHFLKDLYTPYLMEGNSDRGIDVGYLVRKALPWRYELRTHKDRPLHFLYPHEEQSNAYNAQHAPEKLIKSHYFSRDCAELRIFGQDPTRPAAIFLAVHLKSKLDPDGIDPAGRGRRQAEMQTLMEIYKEVRREFSPPVPVILAGDFNGCARRPNISEEFKAIEQTDLENVIEIVGHKEEAAATQVIFSRSGNIQALEIDYIFVSQDLKDRLIADQVGPYRYRSDLKVSLPLPKTLEQRTYLPSDHYPVVATFKSFIR